MQWLQRAFIFIVCGVLISLFCYHLNYTALASYDEAWYAAITRDLIHSGNPLFLTFNSQPFTDHPPLGFILMAIPTLILGSNELSARLVSALLGAASIVLTYLIGTKLKDRMVGSAAAAILLSSMWFMLRARSGNLDVPLLFWSLVTFYSTLKANQNVRWLYLVTISFAALFLTKTLVGVGIVPVLVLTFWQVRRQLTKQLVVRLAILWLVLVLPWYIANQLADPQFLHHHFFQIGARGGSNVYSLDAAKQALLYLQIGVGRWFKIFLGSLLALVIVGVKNKSSRPTAALLLAWLLGFLLPFLFSAETEIWHLLPTYAPLALISAYALFSALEVLPKVPAFKYVLLVSICGLAIIQFKQFSNLIYATAPQPSAEREISQRATSYPQVYLLDAFYPAAVYYSNTHVIPIHWDPHAYQIMLEKLHSNTGEVFLINQKMYTDLQRESIKIEVISSNQEYYLIRNKPNQ